MSALPVILMAPNITGGMPNAKNRRRGKQSAGGHAAAWARGIYAKMRKLEYLSVYRQLALQTWNRVLLRRTA